MAEVDWLDADASERTPLRRGAQHLIARYHAAGVPENERSITCECGWSGHEDLFVQHRRSKGLRSNPQARRGSL